MAHRDFHRPSPRPVMKPGPLQASHLLISWMILFTSWCPAGKTNWTSKRTELPDVPIATPATGERIQKRTKEWLAILYERPAVCSTLYPLSDSPCRIDHLARVPAGVSEKNIVPGRRSEYCSDLSPLDVPPAGLICASHLVAAVPPRRRRAAVYFSSPSGERQSEGPNICC